MAKNRQTSAKAASAAGQVLRNPSSTKAEKAAAASAGTAPARQALAECVVGSVLWPHHVTDAVHRCHTRPAGKP